MVHVLKCWPEYFAAVIDGRKRFEIREKRDRDFQVGDVLHLHEWDPRTELYTGRTCKRKIVFVTNFGQKEDQVVMGIKPIASAAKVLKLIALLIGYGLLSYYQAWIALGVLLIHWPSIQDLLCE